MGNETEKKGIGTKGMVIGYLLLILGVGVVFYAIYSGFTVLTGQSEAAKVFQMEKGEVQIPQESMPEEMKGMIPSGLLDQLVGGIIPIEFLNKMGNLSLHYMLMFLLIFAGGKLGDLGIKMLK